MIEAGAMDQAVNLVKGFEGLSLAPYFCPAGKLTTGYGHVITEPEMPDLNKKIEVSLAEILLRRDLAWAMLEVQRVDVSLTAGQAAALASLVYNIGPGAWRKSTIRQRLAAGDIDGAAGQFRRWNLISGKVSPGLTRRRALEEKTFRGEK